MQAGEQVGTASQRKIKSTPDMQRVLADLIDARRVVRSSAEYAIANGFHDAAKIAKLEAVKLSRASLEMQGHPLRYKNEKTPSADQNAPTHERINRGGGYVGFMRDDDASSDGRDQARSRGAIKRYHFRSAMDMHGEKFLAEHRLAFAAFVRDAELAGKIRVSDMNASCGGSGSRLGGLGNAPQHIRDRHARFEWVSRRLTELEREVADVLATFCITHRDGAPFSAEEFGALLFPAVEIDGFHLGAAMNGLRHLCGHLVELYHSPMCPKVRKPKLIESDSYCGDDGGSA